MPCNAVPSQVSHIIKHFPAKATCHEATSHYLIAWEGYDEAEATKEPARNIKADTPSTVEEYWAAQEQ